MRSFWDAFDYDFSVPNFKAFRSKFATRKTKNEKSPMAPADSGPETSWGGVLSLRSRAANAGAF